jgi:WD40 repeat protein
MLAEEMEGFEFLKIFHKKRLEVLLLVSMFYFNLFSNILLESSKGAVYCIAISPVQNILACGTEDHLVKTFKIPELVLDAAITRNTTPIRHVQYNRSGNYLAVASDELAVKIVNMSDTTQVRTLKVGSQSRVCPSSLLLAHEL